MKKQFMLMILCLTAGVLWAQSSDFSKGEMLFRQNRMEEAIPYLQNAADNNENPKVYEYLSLSYFQSGDYDKAISTINAGMKISGTDKKILALNAGNMAFLQQNYADADRWFSLAISASSTFSQPVLNRANTRVYENKFAEAKADYIKYLEMESDDYRQNEIREMIKVLDEEIAVQQLKMQEEAEEQQRLAEEEQRMAEEMAKAEAEAQAEAERLAQQKAAEEAERAAQEAERKRKLLEEVAASLQETETTSISAGAEEIIDYDYESELE